MLSNDVDDVSSPRVAGVRGNTGCGRRGAPGGIAALLLPRCGCKPPDGIAPIIADEHYRRTHQTKSAGVELVGRRKLVGWVACQENS